MSHTPSERDADSPAPGGSGNPWLHFLAWPMLALVLYVLSSGPVWWLWSHDYLSRDALEVIYFPLQFLPRGLTDMIDEYTLLWAPVPT